MRSFLTLLLAAALALTVPAQAVANAPTTRPAVDTDDCTPSPRYDKTGAVAYPRRVKQRSRITPVAFAALIGLALALGPAASASPTSPASADYPQVGDQAASEEFVDDSTSFRSCKKLRKYYPRGVAKSSAAGDRARVNGFGPAEVNKKVYKANKKLDTNGNRVACEVSAARARKGFRAELLQKQMPTAEAGEYTESVGYLWRVGSYDGVPQAVTMDYNMDRLTFDVNDGIVTDAAWG